MHNKFIDRVMTKNWQIYSAITGDFLILTSLEVWRALTRLWIYLQNAQLQSTAPYQQLITYCLENIVFCYRIPQSKYLAKRSVMITSATPMIPILTCATHPDSDYNDKLNKNEFLRCFYLHMKLQSTQLMLSTKKAKSFGYVLFFVVAIYGMIKLTKSRKFCVFAMLSTKKAKYIWGFSVALPN